MLINSNLQHPPPSLRAYLRHLATCIFLARGVRNLMQRSCVYHSVSCTIILSVVYYPVSCALLGHLCNLSVSCMLQVAVGSYASLGQLCIFLLVLCHSVGCMITLSVMYNQLCIIGQLCTSLSVVHYSISCVLPSQLSQTRSVVLHSVSWMIIPSVVFYSVSCVLSHHLFITPSGEFNPLFPISIFETLSNFSQLQVTQLIEVVKQKIFSKLGILSPDMLKCFIFSLFTVSQSPQF